MDKAIIFGIGIVISLSSIFVLIYFLTALIRLNKGTCIYCMKRLMLPWGAEHFFCGIKHPDLSIRRCVFFLLGYFFPAFRKREEEIKEIVKKMGEMKRKLEKFSDHELEVLLRSCKPVPGEHCESFVTDCFKVALKEVKNEDHDLSEEREEEVKKHMDSCAFCHFQHMITVVELRWGPSEKEKAMIKKAISDYEKSQKERK